MAHYTPEKKNGLGLDTCYFYSNFLNMYLVVFQLYIAHENYFLHYSASSEIRRWSAC